MNRAVYNLLEVHSKREPFAGELGMEVVSVDDGCAVVRMKVTNRLRNVFGSTHGGAIFSLIDEAFQLACNSHGTLAVALNVNITYVAPPDENSIIEAKAQEIYKTRKTASYQCEVVQVEAIKLIATATGLAYRTGKPLGLE